MTDKIKVLTVVDSNGATWAVPVEVIAKSRAAHYAHEFDGDIDRSMAEDTMPLFDSDPYEVEDWAANNMNWCDVAPFAFKLSGPSDPDMQEAWINGEKDVRTIDTAPLSQGAGMNDDDKVLCQHPKCHPAIAEISCK